MHQMYAIAIEQITQITFILIIQPSIHLAEGNCVKEFS